MQDFIYNMRGTRVLQRSTGKVLTLALAASALLPSAFVPAQAAPTEHAIPAANASFASTDLPAQTAQTVKPLTAAVTPPAVTLDFVAADITDVLKALSIETHTNIVSGPEVTGKVTVSLAHVTLTQALDMISHISGFQYAEIGQTYVVGSSATLASFSDQTSSGPATTAVVGFNYSDPTQLTKIITDQYPNVKVTVDKAVGTGSQGGILIVTGAQTDVQSVKGLVGETELGLSKDIVDSTTVVYNIKYDSAKDLQTVLGRLVPNLVVTPGPSLRPPPVAPSTADAGGTTSTTTSYGSTSGSVPTVTSVTGDLPTQVTTESLLLTGSPDDIARAQAILAEVDIMPAQINYQAKVIDMDDTLYNQLGLTYSFTNATTTVGQVTSAGATTSTDQYRTNLPIGYTPLSQLVTIGLQASHTNNDAHVLASPNISAINGQPAAIFIGNNITYVSSITSSTTGQNVTTATVSAGIKLFITGQVDNDGFVTVNLHPEVSSVTFTASNGEELPNVATTEATTTLRVHNGDYIVLGGLAENTITKTMNGVPILDDIPIIGSLFRSNTTQGEHRQLVILIKVTVNKDGTVAATPVGATGQ